MRSIVALIVVFALFVGAVSARSVKRDRLGTAECDICTWVVTQAESLLASNNTEQEIITTLDSACSIFGPFSSECQSLVATYVPQVISLLEQKVPPSQVCQQIGLCSSKAGILNKPAARKPLRAARRM